MTFTPQRFSEHGLFDYLSLPFPSLPCPALPCSLRLVHHQAYRPPRYYFEVVECARRLLLTGCLVFILPNTAGQAAVACVLSTVTVCMVIMLRPFLDEQNFRAYILGCLVVFMSM